MDNVYRIESIKRLNNSWNGNPRFGLTLSELDDPGINGEIYAVTMDDAAVSYEIGNTGYREGDVVTVTFDSAGRVRDMERVPSFIDEHVKIINVQL